MIQTTDNNNMRRFEAVGILAKYVKGYGIRLYF